MKTHDVRSIVQPLCVVGSDSPSANNPTATPACMCDQGAYCANIQGMSLCSWEHATALQASVMRCEEMRWKAAVVVIAVNSRHACNVLHECAKPSACELRNKNRESHRDAGVGGLPDTMEETAAHVQTTTVLPSFNPRVWMTKPELVSRALKAMPITIQVALPAPSASRKPVRQAAADSPKHAPA